MPETTNNLLAAALWYADLGYPVFPCAPGDNKPITKHGFIGYLVLRRVARRLAQMEEVTSGT